MNINPNNITVKRTARYFINGVDFEKAETVWFLLHGYGQIAENFIKKFQILDDGKTLLAAPEALSRFYTDDIFGKIGASWMTREERENEIEDYVSYLNDIYDGIKKLLNGRNVKLNVFGFSQGTATASRWLQRGNVKAENLVLWGGFLPPDFEIENWNASFNSLFIVTGSRDGYLPPEKLAEGEKVLNEKGVKYSAKIFEGGHEMKESVVNSVLKEFLL